VVTNSSVGCWINDPTGCFWRTRSFENKHEEEGVVNWRLLPAGIGNQWVGFSARRGERVAKSEMVLLCFFDPSLGSTAAAKSALLFFPFVTSCILEAPN
jgi:hypothetical protein